MIFQGSWLWYGSLSGGCKIYENIGSKYTAAQKFDEERFNRRKRNALEFRKQNQIKISNKSAALENLNDSEDMNRASETLKKTSKPQLKVV